MPGSKFNRHPTPRLRPPICYPPPGSCLELWPQDAPKYIAGFAHWHDTTGMQPVDWSALLQMPKTLGLPIWQATAFFPGGTLTISAESHWLPFNYIVKISCFIKPATYLWNTWQPVPSTRPQFFDSGILTMINNPVNDYREARIMGSLPTG